MNRAVRNASVRAPHLRVNTSFLVNPVALYSVVWLGAIGLLSTNWATFMTGVSRGFVFLVVGNIAISILVYGTVIALRRMLAPVRPINRARTNSAAAIHGPAAFLALRRYSDILYLIWLAGSLVNIWFSGGLPIIWNLRGDDRTYADYGIPTFSGMIMACGLFASLGYLVLRLRGHKKNHWFKIALVFVYLIATLTRGSMVWMALEMLGVFLLVGRPGFRRIFIGVAVVLLLIVLFGAIGGVRVGEHYSNLTALETPEGKTVFEHVPTGFWWTYLYAAAGSANLNAAIDSTVPLGRPYWSAINLFPTVLRKLVYTETKYEERYPLQMVNESFNVFTLYGGYLADYGLAGCFAITFVLQSLAVYHYLRARGGNPASIIAYAVCFQVIVVSIFTDSLTSWPALFQLFLAFAFGYFARESQRTVVRTSAYGTRRALQV